MNIQFLKANRGDSILVEFNDSQHTVRRILIDGGTKSTYRTKNSKGKFDPGQLQSTIQSIRASNSIIDLLIITHIDDDHIGGIINWIENDPVATDVIGEVWFNAGIEIAKYVEFYKEFDDEPKLQFSGVLETSIPQGVSLRKYLLDKKKWSGKILAAPDVINFYGISFVLLSPLRAGLKNLLEKWKDEAPASLDTAGQLDYNETVKTILENDEYQPDSSVPNESAIAFILQEGERKILFLSDAHADVVLHSLNILGNSEENPLIVDIVKLSHHGSQRNTSPDLLKVIESKVFIVSGNGAVHGLPNKRCLSRVIQRFPDATFCFNYPELIPKIFSEIDYKEFPNFTAVEVEKPFIV